MCIRDSAAHGARAQVLEQVERELEDVGPPVLAPLEPVPQRCLLYTSDAADERSSVDLGGRRIIKKKNTS